MYDIDHGLFDTFEIKGYWWLPDNPSRRIAGVLTFKAGDIQLELFGFLREPALSEIVSASPPFQPKLILGTSLGKLWSLYRATEVSKTYPLFSNDGRCFFISEYLFCGVHFDTEEDLAFASASFNLSDLEGWLHQQPFTSEDRKEGDRSVSCHCHRFPEPLEIELKAHNSKLCTNYLLSSKPEYFSETLRHLAFFQIEPGRREPFDWYQKLFVDLRNLLAFFVGKPVYAKYFSMHVDDCVLNGRSIAQCAAVFFKQPADRLSSETAVWDMLLRFPQIKGQIADVFNAWFEKADKLRTVLELLFGTFYNTKQFLRFQFLSLIHAIESYDRIQNESAYVSETEYEPIRAALVEAIPKDVASDFKTSLKTRIKYGNQFSLRKRLNNLFGNLQPATVALVSDNSKDFVSRVVDTRNYFTHYTDELRDNAVHEGADLYYATHRLRIFLTILLLKELGIEESVIVDAVRANRTLNYIYELPNPSASVSEKHETQPLAQKDQAGKIEGNA